MTYELAKQLKDAGFPGSNSWFDNDGKYFTQGADLVQITLSELIEACGLRFISLRQFVAYWSAVGGRVDVRNSKAHWIGQGQTPEEAVAKLWLELNKK